MKEYVKKPIPIHAFRWDGNVSTLKKNVGVSYPGHFTIDNPLLIHTKEGIEECPIGDYVIRGIHGEYYPCDPKIFKESYKEVK